MFVGNRYTCRYLNKFVYNREIQFMNEWQEYIKTVEEQVAEEVRKQYPDLKFYVNIEDPRYPQVIFNDNPDQPEWDDYKGYWWDLENNKLGANFCTCGAYEPDECSCGAWDDVDKDWWYADDHWEYEVYQEYK